MPDRDPRSAPAEAEPPEAEPPEAEPRAQTEGPAADPAAPPPGAPVGDAALLAAARARWAELRRGRLATHDARAHVEARLAGTPRVSAQPCAAVRAAIEARDPAPGPDTLLDGSLDALTSGECRVLTFAPPMGVGLEVVSRPDGHVLLIRIVEEG